jgi:hypothetical protein
MYENYFNFSSKRYKIAFITELTRQAMYVNVTLRRVHITTVAVEKQ